MNWIISSKLLELQSLVNVSLPTLLSTLYDLNHHLWLDANLTPLTMGERGHAVDHLAYTDEGDLILNDRGYPAFWFLVFHQSLGRNYCMRLPFNFHKKASDFYYSKEEEITINLEPGERAKTLCLLHDLPTDPLRIRLIRVHLDSGEQEILITSLLDPEKYPVAIFKDLYHLRWGHEEGYKHLKVHAELQNWTGRGLHVIFQDLHSKILTLNLTAMHVTAAQIEVGKKTKHRKFFCQV
ncbi:MAG: transposase, partial [Magnetococcales bacterium]|nr:transposase [Magnetococcales bacterium]